MSKKVNETEVEKLKRENEELKKQAEKPVVKKEVEKERYGIGEVPTQFGLSIIDSKTGEPIDINSVLAKILNNQEILLKAI